MRVLHVLTRYLGGGSERNLVAHMRWERDGGHEVELAVGRWSRVPSDLPFVVHPVSALVRGMNPAADVLAFGQLRGLIKRGRYDVVHTHQSKAGAIGRFAARGRARAVVHTVHMCSFGPGYSRAASAAYAAVERAAARSTDLIVCVGQELRDRYLEAGIGRPEQYAVVRSPIDVERFGQMRDLAEARRAEIRAWLGIEPGARVIATVGALEPRKRQRLLIERLAPALRGSGTVLLVTGDGPERQRLQRRAFREGAWNSVRFLGHVTDVTRVLGAADVLVHASEAEGVPQVVIQALAAGLPVVATEVIGLREIPGAPVTVVAADGEGLLEAVEGTLASRPSALPLSALDEWRAESVQRQLEAWYRGLEEVVRGRAGAPRAV